MADIYNLKDVETLRKVETLPLPDDTPKRPKVLRTFKQLVQEYQPLPFIVDGLLPDSGWTLLVGLPGVGKSTIAAQLCDSLQYGKPFLGMETKQRKALYIQCDAPTEIWREQIRRIAPDSEALTLVDVPDHALDHANYIEIIKRIILYVKPGFLVFDALNSLTGKDINTKAGLQPIFLMNELTTIGDRKLPWMLLHHPTKSPHSRGVNSASGFGGISAACSVHLTLSSNRLKVEKSKLSGKRSIDLSRTEEGLWCAESDDVNGELAHMGLAHG